MSGPSYCGFLVEKWTDAALEPVLRAIGASAEEWYRHKPEALSLRVFAHQGAAWLYIDDIMGSVVGYMEGPPVLEAIAAAAKSPTWQFDYLSRSSFGVHVVRCLPNGKREAEVEYGEDTEVPASVEDIPQYLTDLITKPIVAKTGWSKELLRDNDGVFGPAITEQVEGKEHPLLPYIKRRPEKARAESAPAKKPASTPDATPAPSSRPTPPPGHRQPSANDPFGPWESNPKMARRCAAALPLWLAILNEGKVTRAQADNFSEVLSDVLAFNIEQRDDALLLMQDFLLVTRFATQRVCLSWVANTLKTRADREVPLWILVDHAMHARPGNTSEILGLLLDAFGMGTRDFIKLMTESGDLDVIEHPRTPEKPAVKKRCIVTRENKYVEFISLDEDAPEDDD